MVNFRGWLGVLVLVGLILSACGGGDEPESAPSSPIVQPSATVDELSTLIAMQQVATEVPTASPWPTHTVTFTPTVTPPPSVTPTPLPTSTAALTIYPTNTPRPTQISPDQTSAAAVANGDVESQEHYWFARPFPRDPTNVVHDYLSRSYAYGTTGSGQFNTHHGVDIQNSTGTPILAVADGWVIYAGDDKTEMFGPQNDFYGFLVVLEHDLLAPNGQPVYSLYGHMSQVDVETGQRVKQSDKIGEVGSTGVALGPHLHLEVRIGNAYDYNSTYNPDLWLRPWNTYGTLAGRVTNQDGSLAREVTITLRSEGGRDYYATSYADDEVNGDPVLGENFACGDLPQGQYRVFVRTRSVMRFESTVMIEPGKTSWLDITLK